MNATPAPQYGAVLLRLALGTMWIAPAALKWFVYTIPGFAGWLASAGLPAFMARPVHTIAREREPPLPRSPDFGATRLHPGYMSNF